MLQMYHEHVREELQVVTPAACIDRIGGIQDSGCQDNSVIAEHSCYCISCHSIQGFMGLVVAGRMCSLHSLGSAGRGCQWAMAIAIAMPTQQTAHGWPEQLRSGCALVIISNLACTVFCLKLLFANLASLKGSRHFLLACQSLPIGSPGGCHHLCLRVIIVAYTGLRRPVLFTSAWETLGRCSFQAFT